MSRRSLCASWLTVHATSVGLRRAPTSAAAVAIAGLPQRPHERLALADELLARSDVEAVDIVVEVDVHVGATTSGLCSSSYAVRLLRFSERDQLLLVRRTSWLGAMEGFAEPAARHARPDLDGQEPDGCVEHLLDSHPRGIPPNASLKRVRKRRSAPEPYDRLHDDGRGDRPVLGPDRLGAEPADAPARVRRDRDRRGGGAARRRGRGAPLDQHRRALLRLVLEHDAVDRRRRRGDRARPPAVGEQRPDDVLLLRRRARGAARVRPRRAARAAPVRPAAARRAGRRRGADRDLPELQCGSVDGAWLGGRDVDRYGLRPRAARPRRAALPRSATRLHADDRRRRRHRGADRDRGVLLRGHRASTP